MEEEWNGGDGSGHKVKTKVGGGRGWGREERGERRGESADGSRFIVGDGEEEEQDGVLLVGTFTDTLGAVHAHWTSCWRVAGSRLLGFCFAKANKCSDLIIPQFWARCAKLCRVGENW